MEVENHDNSNSDKAKTKARGILIDSLAKLPERAILDEARLASVLCVTTRTIRRMVSRFEIPPPISLAGRSVWFAGRVLEHLEAAFDKAEREAGRQARKISELYP